MFRILFTKLLLKALNCLHLIDSFKLLQRELAVNVMYLTVLHRKSTIFPNLYKHVSLQEMSCMISSSDMS